MTQALADGSTVAAPDGALARRSLWSRHPLFAQVVRYVLVGAASTAFSAVLFYLLRTWWPPLPSSLVAVVVSTAFSTEANRRFTFAAADVRWWRVHVHSAGTVAFYACYGAAVLAVLHAVVADPTRLHETLAIAAASVLGGATRFLLLRRWVFARPATWSRDESVVLLYDERRDPAAR